jgi:hypothetical protein
VARMTGGKTRVFIADAPAARTVVLSNREAITGDHDAVYAPARRRQAMG